MANFILRGDPKDGPGREPAFPRWRADQSVVAERGDAAISQVPVLRLTNEGFLEERESAAGRCGWFFQTAFAGSN